MEILARMGRVDEALALLDQFIATNDTIKTWRSMPGSMNYVPNMKWKNILPGKSVISITSFCSCHLSGSRFALGRCFLLQPDYCPQES